MHTDNFYTEPVAKEIIDLHIFFEDWFGGSCENSEQVFKERLLSRFAENSGIVMPGGEYISSSAFAPVFKDAHGSNPGFKISIRNINILSNINDDMIIVLYEEWQRNAINSSPPDNGRLSTAIFIKHEAAPNGLQWVHVHETWLPQDVVNQEKFDW